MRKVLLLFASLVLLDVALRLVTLDGELFGRRLPPFGTPTARQEAWLRAVQREGGGPGRFDAELGWSWRPSSEASRDVHLNAWGARGEREYPDRPPAGGLRILTFGDSFVFGDEIPDAATFQAILEHRRSDWEVVNFGVSGYGTDQSLLRMRREAPGRGARVIAIGLLLENIGRNVNRYRPLWSPATGFCATKPRFRLQEGELVLVPQPYADASQLARAVADGSVLEDVREHEYWLERPAVPLGGASSILRLGAAVQAYRERSVPRLWSDTGAEPFRTTLALVEAFRREALAGGAELCPVLIFPAIRDVQHALAGHVYWDPLLEELRRRGVPALDLAQALARRARASGDENVRDAYYYGYHLSSAGNAVVADELEAWIEAELARRASAEAAR